MVRTRAQKEELVASIRSVFDGADTLFLVSLAGINSNDVNKLRAELREKGARMQVVKNRLAKRAATESPVEAIEELFRGPTAVVYHETEPVSTAKTLVDFAKDHPALEIRGGLVGKAEAIDADGVKAVADLPSLDDARAMILQLINAPATQLARLLSTPATQLATVLERKSEQEG